MIVIGTLTEQIIEEIWELILQYILDSHVSSLWHLKIVQIFKIFIRCPKKMSDKWIIVSLQLKYVKRLAVDKNQINHPLSNKKWFFAP